MTTSLRPNKRYIATHDAKGKSVYADSPDQKYRSAGDPPANFLARSYAVSSVPVVMKDDADMKAYLAEDGPTSYTKPDIVIPGGGVNIVTVDMAPGGESAMHHTVSLDYSICVIGTIDHELDGGEKVRLYPGVSENDCQVTSMLTGVGPYHSKRHHSQMDQCVKDRAGTISGNYIGSGAI